MTAPPQNPAPVPEEAPGTGEVILSARDLRLSLGGKLVLGGVDLDIHNRGRPGVTTGQIVGILGPSGVGKTRLLRILAGLDEADQGTISTRGLGRRAGEVRVVFQNYPLLRHRTIRGNLAAAGRFGGLGARASSARAEELLERFGLASCADRYPVQVSGGQRQRAAIAQQLACDCRLILLDEPFSGLDPASLEDVMELLSSVAHLHDLNTLVLVTHDVRAALAASDTLHLLGRDRLPDGSPAPGARIQATYDLVERGMAWRPDIQESPEFFDLEREVCARFRSL